MSIPECIIAKFKIQDELKDRISRAKLNFKKSPKERITKTYCETRLENLERLWSTFETTHLEIISQLDRTLLGTTIYYKSNVYDLTEELYVDYKVELKEVLSKFMPASSNINICDPTKQQSAKSCKIKIPAANIPIFNGNYAQWPSFRDLFKSLIDSNTDLDDVQKLQYLKCHVSGEAESLLRHVSITSDNFSIAWKKLESRYDNKKCLGKDILKRFLNFKGFSVESSNSIKLMLDSMDECLEALTKLGVDTSSWDLFVILLLSEKLDPISRKEWESKSSLTNEFDTIAEFREFLQHKFKSLAYLDKPKPKVSLIKQVLHTSEVSTISANNSCQFCKGNHKLINCKLFKNEPLSKRREFVKVQRLCFNCLGTNHSVFACRQAIRCDICKRKHSLILHSESSFVESKGSEVGVAANSSILNEKSKDVVSCVSSVRSQVLLATALVNISTKSGALVSVRCLLDQGSMASFITESAVQKLGLKKMHAQMSISGIGSDGCSVSASSSVQLKLRSIHDSTYVIVVKAYVLSKLTTVLPRDKVEVQMWPELQTFELADPRFNVPNQIEVLLGAEVYSEIILEGIRKGLPGCPVAQKTKLGWILSGITNSIPSNNEIMVGHIGADVNEDCLLRKFWEIEAEPAGNSSMLTEEEQECETLFKETTRRDKDGRYVVKLPFRTKDPLCKYGNLKDIAARSLFKLEKRLMKDSELKIQYSESMDMYLDLNHMERVPTAERNKSAAVYLPHHPVVRSDKTTTKVRIVFNASQKGFNGVSLNDELLCGPKLQPDLRHLIMRWRSHPICLSADIVKMYLQIRIADEDIDCLRLLWRDKNGSLEHYRMLRVTFGTTSAPYLAVKALQQLAVDEGDKYPAAAERVLSDYYMDDLMTGAETLEEALKIYNDMNALLNKGGFTLQKWISNSTEFLEKAGELQDNGDKRVEIRTEKEAEGIRKVLGLHWQSRSDEFKYTVNLPDMLLPVTKRRVVSDISRQFDPLGFIAPVIITSKIFIQKLWVVGIEWDQELPPDLLQEWIGYRTELNELTGFKINRWVEMRRDDLKVELQGFCDASMEAYGAVVYVRIIDRNGQVHVNLVTSKTKVAPVKQISIPRLELCSAVLLAKLLDEVARLLKIPNEQVHAWTDSTIVLAWLSSHPRRWNTFVANRVSEIISLFNRKHWGHVRSGENPADLASRGMKPAEFVENLLWKKGPKWLSEDNIIYSPLEEGKSKVVEIYETEEEIKVKCCSNIIKEECSLFVKYSTLRKQVRVIAWCRRFVKLVRDKPQPTFPKWLTSTELEEARKIVIRYSQTHYFAQEIKDLKVRKTISKCSKLRAFTPILDADDILRVGGRLQNSGLSDVSKHPILVSQYSYLAKLLIGEAHEKTLHGGTQLMLAYLRAKYWIINAKSKIKSYIRECIVCVRHNARAYNPIMGQLPSARVTPSRPFKRSGVDFAGPIAVRSARGRGHHATKGYICLFICMCTRAIHLEMVSDLSSDAFIAAFKRFVARRGHCAELWSDNGTNFVGAERELESLFTSERSSVAADIQDWLATNGTQFHRIPPHSPHFGGLWEAGVKSTKHHLRRVIGTATLTFEEMSTLLSQIEACLNSRPITQVDSDCNEPYPLTPGHFLVGEPLLLVSDVSYRDSKITLLKRWQLVQGMVQEFWRRWSQEYLTQFLQRHKWQQPTPEPSVGDLLFIIEKDLPPARWLFGVIVEKHPGLDKVTRVVSVRCKGSIIKRPIAKICIIPKITD